MEKRYQVFVSSTYEDLKEERASVMQTLLELNCIPTGMELFPAADDDQISFIKRAIDDCDYYMVILAGRYGSVNKRGISYTELEYNYAKKIKKPIMAFVIDDPLKLPAFRYENDYDRRKKLEKFRTKLKNRLCKKWKNAGDLSKAVGTSITNIIKTNPSHGWVRANFLPDWNNFDTVEFIQSCTRITQVGIQNVYENLGSYGTQNDWLNILKKAKKKVDMQGRTLHGWTNARAIEKIMIDKIIKENVDFRWLVLDENNIYMKNLIEENEGVGELLLEKAARTKKLLLKIKAKLPSNKKRKLQIRYFADHPLYCSIIRSDDDYYVSNYMYSVGSVDCPFIHLSGSNSLWCKTYQKEFDAVWRNSKK